MFLWLAAGLAAGSGCGRVGFEDQLLDRRGNGGGTSWGSGGLGSGGSTFAGAPGFGGTFPGTGGYLAAGGTLATGGNSNVYPVPLYYQNFEEELTEESRTSDSGSLSLQNANAYRGTSSLKIGQSSEDASAYVVAQFAEPLHDQKLYFRAWVFIPSEVVINGANLVGFHPADGLGVDVNAYADRTVEVYNRVTELKTVSAATAFPQGQWFCLQIANYIHDTQGSVDVAVDETSVVAHGPTDTLPTGGIDRVVYGMPWATEEQENFVVYFDEVAIASQPIPCQPQ